MSSLSFSSRRDSVLLYYACRFDCAQKELFSKMPVASAQGLCSTVSPASKENLEVDHDECHLRLGLSENMMSVIVLSDTDVQDDRTCPPRMQITGAHSSNNNIYRGLLFGALDQEHMEGALLHHAGDRNKENPVHGATNEQGWFAQGAAVFKIYHVLKCLKAYVVYRKNPQKN
ncbi:uncharacterized protein [Aegilops tauschii subsp. strangulata]|uniref:uncharacterized protein n=1 Tax=Aegilops tauschii subsp. strangulata TaxID=200361 RepID=UPI003CC8958B